MSEARIPPGSRREIGWINWLIGRVAGRVSRTNPPNLFLTMGRQRGLFRGWLHFAGRMMPGGKLPRRETELVILRVAHLCSCRYEFDHHVRLGRRAGLSEFDITRVQESTVGSEWSERECMILEAVDCLHRDRDIPDPLWTDIRRHLSEPECVELIMLAGNYEMLATLIGTLRIEPDTRSS